MRKDRVGPAGPDPDSGGPESLFDTVYANMDDFQRRAGRLPGWSAARGLLFALLALFLLIFVSRAFVVVQAGERAVVFSQLSGVKPGQLAEGLHLNIPILWVPTKYDVKSLTYTMSGGQEENGSAPRSGRDAGQVPDDALDALTSDGLPVSVDLSVRFHVDPDRVWKLHQEQGPDFIDKVVRPQTRSVTRNAFAEFSVIDAYSGNRQKIVEEIQGELGRMLGANYVVLDEVLLRDIRFPPEFQGAIEQKQVAQQQAQQMVYELDRAKSERRRKVIEAEGEAASIRAIAEALAQNPQLVQYEYVKRLPADAKIMVTDANTILNMGDFLNAPARTGETGGGQ